MFNEELNEVEIVPPSAVSAAARDFASALAETPQFARFEAAADRLNQDSAAQRAIEAFQTKQQSLQMMLRLNAVSPEDRSELERLQQAFLTEPSVDAYFQAQAELKSVCQAASEIISQSTGLNYAATCGAGCCG
jgi:cell fate (sporulation/competence/biofilm development) regulator YlbF (YheA/YmcA/DUF963 family)